jgi:hypothetical protein
MSYNSSSFSDFVGKTINAAMIGTSNDRMFWKVDGEWYDIYAEGDCCSASWFEHCDDGSVLQNAVLTSFESFSREPLKGEERDYETLQIDMLKFKTSKGYCTIEFRNSSNGYYSGRADIQKMDKEPNLDGYKNIESF